MQYWVALGGYVVRKITKNINCEECAAATIQNVDKNKISFSFLLSANDRGGFVFHSCDVFKIINLCGDVQETIRKSKNNITQKSKINCED